jgi:hypothetical protein
MPLCDSLRGDPRFEKIVAPIESLRRSLEVFNNDTGATTVFMGGSP